MTFDLQNVIKYYVDLPALEVEDMLCDWRKFGLGVPEAF